jgi:hypothetical protein
MLSAPRSFHQGVSVGRLKPAFRLHLSVASHRNTAVIWSNLQDRAMYAELGRLAIQKYAPKTDNQFYLNAAELMAVTGCSTPAAATNRWVAFLGHCRVGAESLGGHSPVTAESLSGHWRVTFRNLAEKHGMSKSEVQVGPRKSKKEEVRSKSKKELSSVTNEASPKPDPAPPTETETAALGCARVLANWIKSVFPGTRVPDDLGRWAKTYEQMLRIDKRNPLRVHAQIKWLFSANQKNDASFVVLSAAAHRKKFDRIEISMGPTTRGPGPRERERVAQQEGYQKDLRRKITLNRAGKGPSGPAKLGDMLSGLTNPKGGNTSEF